MRIKCKGIAMRITFRRSLVIVSGVVFLIILLLPFSSVLHAKDLEYHTEFGQGLTNAQSGPDRYFCSARFHPTIELLGHPKMDFSLTVGGAYVNPGISALRGGRIAFELVRIQKTHVNLASIRIIGEGLWGTRDDKYVGGAAQVDIGRDGLLLLTLRYSREYEHDYDIFEFSLGVNLSTLFGSRESDIDFMDDI